MVTVFAAGDVFNGLPDEWSAFRHLSPLLSTADIVFANCEGVYTDSTERAPNRRAFHAAPPGAAKALGRVPFHVMTMAANHVLDAGYSGLQSTLDVLHAQGIATTGAGQTLADALKPAIVERAGKRIAFLGFCSHFPVGHEARADRGGLAPLRVHTHYSPANPNIWDPGADPLITTTPDQADLAGFRSAIANARKEADHVIVGCHWGHSSLLRGHDMFGARNRLGNRKWRDNVADYEVQLARDAIDHGADAVICHHQLSLRGVGFHRKKPIFFGMGMLVQHFHEAWLHDMFKADPAFPHMPFTPDHLFSGIAALDIDDRGAITTGFIPAMIEPDGSTRPLKAGEPGVEMARVNLVRLIGELDEFATDVIPAERGGWAWFELSPK
jgi:poly-gamma-glutamate synthesis protein (capsule biosynthesis protein)